MLHIRKIYKYSIAIQAFISLQNEHQAPEITVPYQSPDVCAVRGDSGVGQLMYSTVAIIILTIVALLV